MRLSSSTEAPVGTTLEISAVLKVSETRRVIVEVGASRSQEILWQFPDDGAAKSMLAAYLRSNIPPAVATMVAAPAGEP